MRRSTATARTIRLPGMFLYLSIGFYGLVAWSIPSIMAAAIGDFVGPKKSGAAIVLSGFLRMPRTA